MTNNEVYGRGKLQLLTDDVEELLKTLETFK